MINNNSFSEKIENFFFDVTPETIRENTRVLTIALAESEYFDVLDKSFRAEIFIYLHNVEDILLSGFQLKNSSHEK